jgi:hypothetical protein
MKISTRLRQLVGYPTRLTSWLRLGALGLTTLLINGGAVWYAFFTRDAGHEDGIRGVGTALQCIGIVFVIVGVLTTRAQFGLPSLWGAVAAWFQGIPAVFPKTQHLVMNAVLTPATAFGEATVRLGLKPTATAEEKIEFLLNEVKRHDEELGGLTRRVRQQRHEIETLISAEAADRAQDVTNVRKLLTSHATGGLDLSFCGAIYLLFGVVLGTLPYSWLSSLAMR